MKSLIPYLIIVILPLHIQAQENKSGNLVDAGRLVVDLIQLFKKDKETASQPVVTLDKSAGCQEKMNQSACFSNKSKNPISLLIFNNTVTSDSLDLIISDRGSECTYLMPAGVYTFIVTHIESGNIARKGQLKLNPCEDQEFEMAAQ